MQLINSFLNRSNILTIFYIFLFYVFVFPYSIGIDGQGVSANYLFVFFPLIALLIKREIAWPPKSVFFFMAMLSLIFLVGSIVQVEHYDLILRRSASFFVFMSIFAFMFVRMDSDMIRAFKFTIILFTLYESSLVILIYISVNGNDIGLYGKGIFGSQRIAFVYLIGFWSLALLQVQNIALKIVKFIALYIILAGILLTYSRSSVVGLFGSIAFYFIYLVITTFKESQSIAATVWKIFSKAFYLFILLVLFATFFKGATHFYSATIYQYIQVTYMQFFADDEKITEYEDQLITTLNNIIDLDVSPVVVIDILDIPKDVSIDQLELYKMDKLMVPIEELISNSDTSGISPIDVDLQKELKSVEWKLLTDTIQPMRVDVRKWIETKHSRNCSVRYISRSITGAYTVMEDIACRQGDSPGHLLDLDLNLTSSQIEFIYPIIVQIIENNENKADISTFHYQSTKKLLSELRADQQVLKKAKIKLARAIEIENDIQLQAARALQYVNRIEMKYSNERINAEKNCPSISTCAAEAKKIYLTYIKKGRITHAFLMNQLDKVNKAQYKKYFTINRLITIELLKMMADTKKQLKTTQVQESINKINQEIYDIEALYSIFREESNSQSENINKSISMYESSNMNSSLGYRVNMHKLVFDKTYERPLTGSSFLGVWSMFENREGSAHSQYLDILFRVGIFAFIAYLLFLYKVTNFLYKKDLGLFFGFVGFLFIGLFHETIKLSQGGFIFAFLFAMWAQQRHHLIKSNAKPS